MSAVEERVVQMKFDSAAFQRGVASTMQSLAALNKSLQLQGATKGLDGIGAAASKQTSSLKNIEIGVNSVADRFKAMSVVAISALATISSQAVSAGARMVKSFTLAPLIDGFREYETQMGAVQTILSNTQAAGTNLKDVNATLKELNEYSDQTIYNFSEMAKNIGTFTAAGVDLKTATLSIKGIANLAALSGSNSQQASTAMYQLSQAISAGRVSLEDWNSVVNAGMGGAVFQRALAQNAEKIGTLDKGAVKLKGSMKNVVIEGKSFRESITAKPGEESWLTSKVLTQTLAQFTGDLSDAALKAQGFDKAMIKSIQNQAKMAKNAATQVKTLTQLLGTLKESAGSGWAQTWQTIFGDFDEAKVLFTNVNNVLGEFISSSADARNKVLADWKALGGRKVIIDAISNAFTALTAVVKPIGQAFRQIFPAVTGKQLYEMSLAIRNFTEGLKIGGTTANNLRRTFAGFFAVLGIGWEIVKQATLTVLRLFGVISDGSGGFLKTTASIGDFLVAIHKALVEGKGLEKVFGGIGRVLAVPIRLIKQLAGFLGSLFEGVDGTKAADSVIGLAAKLEPLGRLGGIIASAWGMVLRVIDNVAKKFASVGTWASEFFGDFGDSVKEAFSGLDFGDVLKGLNTGLLAGVFLMLRNLIGGGGLGGILDNVGDAFENLTGALGAMQNTLRAATLLQIAAAVGILALAMNTLSKIDAAGLARASAAITVMFAQLLGSLLLFEKFSGFVGFAKMPFIAVTMILMAAAVNVLAAAMAKMAELDWNGLAKGLTGVTVLLAALVGVSKFIVNPGGLIATAVGMVILAAAIKVLVSAVTDLSGLSWEDMAKGLIGVGSLLGALALFTKFAAVGKGAVLQGAGLVLLAAGIKILASAVKDMAGLSWEEIGRGLVTLAGALAIITAALYLIPPTAPLAAAGVLGIAISLGMVADALGQLGGMSWGEIGKGLTAMFGALLIITAALIAIPPTAPLGAAGLLIVALALNPIADVLSRLGAMDWGTIGKSLAALVGAMLIIVVGVSAMTGALTGAAALLVVAASLAILTPVLIALGNMSWGEIGKGLLVIAAAFVIFGVAGALLTPVVPTLLLLGAAILLLGAGAALAGAGVLALSVGLAALAISGAAGTAALVAMVSAMIGLIPQVMEGIGKGIVAFAKVIATAGPAITKALVTVLNALITAIAVNSPKIANQLYKMLLLLIQTMNKYAGPLADAGAKLIVNILNGVARNMGKMVTAATNVAVAFINGVAKNQPRIVDAGVKMIIGFVNGVANAIRSNSAAMNAAGRNLGSAIVQGMVGGISGGIGAITSAAKNLASSALSSAKGVLGINSPSKEFEKIGKYTVDGFRKGLDGNKGQIDAAFKSMKDQLSSLMRESAKDVDSLEAKLKKLTHARKKDYDAIRKTRSELSQARKEERVSKAAYNELTKKLNDENSALGRLANQQDSVAAKLKTANEKLADAIKVRDDYKKQITDQYKDLPEIANDETLASYVKDLRKQISDTQAFATAIQKLRGLGLNDDMYKELLTKGPESLPFIKDVLASGKDGVNELNKLGSQLNRVAAGLGGSASSSLYQAGVNAAQGLVNGLNTQMKNLEKMMDKLADAMVKAIKEKLGIKSPSRVFAQMGVYSAEGLIKGLEQSNTMVGKSAEGLADTAVASLRKSLAAAAKMSLTEVDVNPTIRPVLDLSDIRKNAGKIRPMLPTLSVGGAYQKATDVSAAVRNLQTNDEDDPRGWQRPMVALTQNNYSPKALSSADIYRQTKNQLSVAKGALATSAGQS